MNLSIVELVVASLAVWEVVEIWRHSHLLAGWRARAEIMDGLAGTMLRCGFCLAPWVSWAACLVIVACPDRVTWLQAKNGAGLVLTALAIISTIFLAVGAWRSIVYYSNTVGTPIRNVVLFWCVWAVAVAGAVAIYAVSLWQNVNADSLTGLWFLLLLPLKLGVLGFAVARLANLGNDLTHEYNRTPHADDGAPGDSKSGFEKEPAHAGPDPDPAHDGDP